MGHILRCLEIIRSVSQIPILPKSLLELNYNVLGHYPACKAFGRPSGCPHSGYH